MHTLTTDTMCNIHGAKQIKLCVKGGPLAALLCGVTIILMNCWKELFLPLLENWKEILAASIAMDIGSTVVWHSPGYRHLGFA